MTADGVQPPAVAVLFLSAAVRVFTRIILCSKHSSDQASDVHQGSGVYLQPRRH